MPEALGKISVDVVGIMPRCSTCRWWQTSGDDRNWLPRSDGRGHCMIADGMQGRPVESSSLAYADDGDYFAVLVTAPDFGCVQWKAKPDA